MEYRLIKPLIHPPGYPDENPMTYLIRIAQLNDYKSYRWLFDSNKVPTQNLSLQKIYPILGDTDWSGYELGRKFISDFISLYPNEIQNRILKYCPLCLQEQPFFRVHWQIKVSMCCPHHGVWLSYQCEFCKSPLEVKNHKIDACSCSKAFSEAKPEVCSQDVINLQRFIEGDYSNMGDEALRLLDNPDELDMARRIQLVRSTIRWIDKEQRGQIIPQIDLSDFVYAREYIDDASEALFTGKAGFFSFLKKIHGVTPNAPQVSDHFSHFYLEFFDRFSGQVFHQYRQLIEQYINRYWTKPLSRRNSHFSSRTIDDHPWIPLQQACREFEIHKSTLKSAIEQRLVRSESLEKEKRVVTLVYKPDLIAREDRLKSLLSAKDAASALGLTKAQFARLREVEGFEAISKPNEQGGAKWKFYRDDIYHYCDLFLDEVSNSPGDHWSLPQLLQYFGGQIDDPLITILQAVKNQELTVAARLESGSGLSSMLFSQSEFLAWYEKKKFRSNVISIPVAAKIMKIQQEFAYQLVEAGLLELSSPSEGTTRWLTHTNIEQFHQKYILLSKLAKETKRSSRTLMSYFASIGICPVDQGWEKPLRQKVYEKEKLYGVQILAGTIPYPT